MSELQPPRVRIEQLWYSQEKPGLGWLLLSVPLAFASLFVRAAVAIKNMCYALGLFRPQPIEGAKVLSVGNLVVGGAGKTPAVIFLTKYFLNKGKRVAVISRGYGRRSNSDVKIQGGRANALEVGDEPSLIAETCRGALVLVGKNKLKLAKRARELSADVIIIDDGMQHRRLARDAEIVVVDGEVGFGNNHMLPWGPLREPSSSIARANLIWWSGNSTQRIAPEIPAVQVEYSPASVRDNQGIELSPSVLRGKPVFILTGIARPDRFHKLILRLGAVVTGVRSFADHHWFSESELDEIRSAAERAKAIVITTEKDLTRLPADFNVWTLRMESRIIAGEEQFQRLLSFPEI
jgi:tetraacyldisaccharide 4'-kinase